MLPDISKVLPCEKVYEDLLRPSARELGGAFTNVVKTARFLLAPFDYLATQQDRFQRYLKRVADKVPPENLVEASPLIVGKTFESLRYLEEESILTEMYINILSVEVDKTKTKSSHPAFPIVLSNLCKDEAIIIHLLNSNTYDFVSYSNFDINTNLFTTQTVTKNTFPTLKLDFPENFMFYMDHLNSLHVAGIWQNGNQIPDYKNGIQVGVHINHKIQLQEFGKMLVNACAVDNIDEFIKK